MAARKAKPSICPSYVCTTPAWRMPGRFWAIFDLLTKEKVIPLGKSETSKADFRPFDIIPCRIYAWVQAYIGSIMQRCTIRYIHRYTYM